MTAETQTFQVANRRMTATLQIQCRQARLFQICGTAATDD